MLGFTRAKVSTKIQTGVMEGGGRVISFDDQLVTSLLTTHNRLIANMLSQAMQTYSDRTTYCALDDLLCLGLSWPTVHFVHV